MAIGKTPPYTVFRAEFKEVLAIEEYLSREERLKEDRRRETRINELTELLLERLGQAVSELDTAVLRESVRTKTVRYENAERPDKPTEETVEERECLRKAGSVIDRSGLKQLTAALAELKDIHADMLALGGGGSGIEVTLGEAEELSE